MMATGKRWKMAVVAIAVTTALGFASPSPGGEPVSILGMAWTPEPASALVVSATGPLVYGESRPAPGVVQVDFADAVLPGAVPPVANPAAGLEGATLAEVQEGGASFARLTLRLASGVEATLAALPAGLEVRLVGASRVAAKGAAVSDLLAVADERGVSVVLAAGGPLVGKTFTLSDPPRVVVDLPGVVNRVNRRVHPVEAAGIQRVRIAQFATEPSPVVRVVVDLERPLPYTFTALDNGAVLRVGESSLAAAAEPEQPPAMVAEATPAPAVPPDATPAAAAEAPPPAASPAPVVMADATPAAAAETPPPAAVPAPVVVADAAPLTAPPVPVSEPAPAPAAKPATQAEAAPPPAAAPPTSPAPAPKPVAESPWTSTPRAMAEQAVPVVPPAGVMREVQTEERRFTGEPISMNLKDADIKDVLRTFARITGLNIVVDPDVTGSATVNLENVPWDQCLDIILRINRLDYVVENNVLRVARIDRLTQEKRAYADFKKQEEAARPMRTVTKTLSYARAKDVERVIRQERFILSDRGAVVVDDRTNTLIIRDAVDRMEGILALIDGLDQPNPQVIIEARVVETTRTFSRALGVNWGFVGLGDAAHGTTTGLQFPNSYRVEGGVGLDVPANGGIALAFGDVLDAFNLDFALSAAESDGLVKLVSSPKVMAQNNQLAHIQSGVMIPVQTVANNTVTVTYVNATLSLDVTPQITAEGTVILDIDLRKREPLEGINLQEARNVPISTRDARTTLMVRDGGTTVIGGIFKVTDSDKINAIPGLSKIPVVGWLFKNSELSKKHDELLIFITPRIVKY